MARTYKRDSRGRFSGGGGGGKSGGGKGGASKAQSTRQANQAVTKRLLDAGTTAIGGRLRKKTAGLYQGTAATKKRNADQFSGGQQRISVKPSGSRAGTGAGTRRQMQANATASAAGRARAVSRAASKGTKKMGKTQVSAARDVYRKLRSEQRRGRRYSSLGADLGGRSEAAKAGAATRQLNRMVANRRRN